MPRQTDDVICESLRQRYLKQRSSTMTTNEENPSAPRPPSKSFLRRQGLRLNAFICVPPISMILNLVVYIGLVYSCRNKWIFQTLLLMYVPYIILDPSPSSGGWEFVSPEWRSYARHCICFHWIAEYFNCSLVREEADPKNKSNDFDPNQQYIFCYHPHGVIGMGCNMGLNTNACYFDKVFPGVSV